MTCIISLIDPTINKITKTYQVDCNYLIAEVKAVELNEKLNKKPNIKRLFWKVTTIG